MQRKHPPQGPLQTLPKKPEHRPVRVRATQDAPGVPSPFSAFLQVCPDPPVLPLSKETDSQPFSRGSTYSPT